jgi:hypothetical protein
MCPATLYALFSQVALLRKIPEVSLGYERSADEGNGVFVGGEEVNHQYDKSSRFLASASAYIQQLLLPVLLVLPPRAEIDTEIRTETEAGTGAGAAGGERRIPRVAVKSVLHSMWELQVGRCHVTLFRPRTFGGDVAK